MLSKKLFRIALPNTVLTALLVMSLDAAAESVGKPKVVVIPLFDDAAETVEPEPPASKAIFITRFRYNGFGGPEGADRLCQTEANLEDSLVQNKTFKAWISTGLVTDFSEIGRNFIRSNVPYQLLDGTQIADNFQDLIDNFPRADIMIRSDGKRITLRGDFDRDVWTGVLANGEFSNFDRSCSNWQTTASLQRGQIGDSLGKQQKSWTEAGDLSCFSRARLYCFEQ